MSRVRCAVLISGRGSNMAALVEAAEHPAFPATIDLVLCNVADAPGLALTRGVPTVVVSNRSDRAGHERAIAAALDAREVEIVCLAGWMRLLTPWLVGRYAGKMLNIHPSLLPAFPGLRTHERAIAAGCRLHGCTVHLVTDAMDAGPILGQACVPVFRRDTAVTLSARVLAAEHALYPATLAAFLGGDGPEPDAASVLANPRPVAYMGG